MRNAVVIGLLGMLVTSVTAAVELPSNVLDAWLKRSVLPTDEAQRMIPEFVEKQLEPLPKTLDDWQARRDRLRKEVLSILGIDDLVPAKWDLKLTKRGTIQRDGYRIEKLTFETYPGFSNAALLYIPVGVEGRVPGIVSISGHSPNSKAEDYVQTRNVSLVKRGCVVLSYDYFGYGDRKTGTERHPTGANAHGIRSFSTDHGYQQDKRENLYEAVERWLKPPNPGSPSSKSSRRNLASVCRSSASARRTLATKPSH